MSKETNFLIFCLESYKAYRNLSGKDAVKLFGDYGVFDYIYEFYDEEDVKRWRHHGNRKE